MLGDMRHLEQMIREWGSKVSVADAALRIAATEELARLKERAAFAVAVMGMLRAVGIMPRDGEHTKYELNWARIGKKLNEAQALLHEALDLKHGEPRLLKGKADEILSLRVTELTRRVAAAEAMTEAVKKMASVEPDERVRGLVAVETETIREKLGAESHAYERDRIEWLGVRRELEAKLGKALAGLAVANNRYDELKREARAKNTVVIARREHRAWVAEDELERTKRQLALHISAVESLLRRHTAPRQGGHDARTDDVDPDGRGGGVYRFF